MSNEECFHLGIKALIRNSDDKILLLQSNNKGGYWDIPGGRMQKGESSLETLRREVFEETGISNITAITHFMTCPSDIRISLETGTIGLIFLVYFVDVEKLDTVIISDEHVAYNWFEISEAKDLLVSFPLVFREALAALNRKEPQAIETT